jgi:biotin carboxyl carrier protein
MTKYIYKTSVIFLGLIVFLGSCTNGNKQTAETMKVEVLPEDIVELRADQIKLANVELGAVEMHAVGNILKVNGIVSVAPQNLATVCMPLGGFIKNTTLLPGNSVNKGQTLAVIENQDFVDIQHIC